MLTIIITLCVAVLVYACVCLADDYADYGGDEHET